MKKQNRIHTFALSMMMTGLSVLPVWAFSGQVDSGALDAVTCINHSTGQAVPGTLSGAGFDCSALPRNNGDSIGVVLLGSASGGPDEPPVVGCDQPLQEMEPNNDINQGQFQDLGALEAGGCVAVAASTSVGAGSDPNNPNPNADMDWYVLNTSGASQPVVDFLDFNGGLAFGVFDLDTQQRLEVQCSDAGCAILGQPARIAVLIFTEEATAYTLRFSDGLANGGLQSLSKSTDSKKNIYEMR
jgi:hypothetical protein